MEGSSGHHVHFPDSEDTFLHDADILVSPVKDSTIHVHLGFLQLQHKYEIKFGFDSAKQTGPLAVRNMNPPNINLRVNELRPLCPSGSSYEIVLEMLAHKEKLLKEHILLETCDDPTETVTLVLHARVLGRGKGTPFLKTGIRCIGVETEDESELSDWQGF